MDLFDFNFGRANFISIPGPVGNLEAIITPSIKDSNTVMVITHPHSLYGGTMDNKVVTTLERAGQEMGLTTIRFNFRGVGNSEGYFDQGEGESEDLNSVLNWIKNIFPSQPQICLAGFSFGSYVAFKSLSAFSLNCYIAVAPPVNHFDFNRLPLPKCPWVVIQGTEDEIVPFKEVLKWVESMSKAPYFISFENTTHFFHGQLIKLQKVVKDFLANSLSLINNKNHLI